MTYTIIIAIIMFAILIAVHEFGHLIAAKSVGIKVYEFAIGMGPALFSKEKGGTLYSLRLFPIGGYVSMEEEDEKSPESFTQKSNWQKILVVAAGAIMNLIAALVILIVMYLISGVPVDTNEIGTVFQDMPAYKAGLEAGDKVVSIDGKEITSWTDISESIGQAEAEQPLNIGYIKKGESEITYASIAVDTSEERPQIGIRQKHQPDILYALKYGFLEMIELTKLMGESFQMIFTGQVGMNDVVGPVGIVTVVDQVVQYGLLNVLYLTALISLNLAIVNILPLPALDGGRLLFLLIQVIIRRPIDPEKEMKIHYAGFIVLIIFLVLITIKDINQFILN